MNLAKEKSYFSIDWSTKAAQRDLKHPLLKEGKKGKEGKQGEINEYVFKAYSFNMTYPMQLLSLLEQIDQTQTLPNSDWKNLSSILGSYYFACRFPMHDFFPHQFFPWQYRC